MGAAVHIGLGSNLGDREEHLAAAIEALRRIDAVTVTAISSLYESAPAEGSPPQPRFLNAVALIDCELEPAALLGILQRIETDEGREHTVKWGPRTLDLDILLWGERIVAEPRLQVPHLFLHQRRFALEPLLELTPNAKHPVLGEPLSALLAQTGAQDVVRLDITPPWPRQHPEPSP